MRTSSDLESYQFNTDRVLTPALAVYPDLVHHNIRCMITVLGGDPGRWRPHLKTVKIPEMMRLLVEQGVRTAKCATTRELDVACRCGFDDVLVAFPHAGANARRVAQLAREHPAVKISTLVESETQLPWWEGALTGVFIDVNPGMNRTGIERNRVDGIVQLAKAIARYGLTFRGLHFYDGHAVEADLEKRTEAAHQRYDDLLNIVAVLKKSGITAGELITSGTPAIPCALSYSGFTGTEFRHQISPGTVVYNDLSSLTQLPASYGLRPAVAVVSRVISHPRAGFITCDAGHKSLSVDSGVPNCEVVGHPAFVPGKPSEEHLPIEIPAGEDVPELGSTLYLTPRHVCPTVNNASYAVLVESGNVAEVLDVGARGHERPVLA